MIPFLLTIILLLVGFSNPQSTATPATTILFSTFRQTKTIIWDTCGPTPDTLPLCENIQWGSLNPGTQNGTSFPSSQTLSPSTSLPDTFSSSLQTTTAISTIPSDTGVPTEFRLRALIPGFDEAYVNTTYNGPIIIDVNTEDRLRRRDDLPNNVVSRVENSADFKLMPDGTIRAIGTNQRLIVYRRQTSSVGTPNDYGDVLIVQETTLAQNDLSQNWYFSGCKLDLQHPSTFQIYEIYLLQIARGRYAVKMGAVGAQVPLDFEAYGLCYEPAVSSSSSISSTSNTRTTAISSLVSSRLSSLPVSSQPSSTVSVQSAVSSTLTSSSSSAPSTTQTYSRSSSDVSSTKSSSTSILTSSSTLNAYDIITLETLYYFCSDLLRSTVVSTSIEVTSSLSAIISTETSISSELVVSTSSYVEYSSTSYIATETTRTNVRRRKTVVAKRQTPYTTPSPLTSFSDAEVRSGCWSAIMIVPITTIESTSMSVNVIPYLSTTYLKSTETSYSTEVVSSTIQSVLTRTAVANGYYKMRNDSLGVFDNNYFYIDAKSHTPIQPDTQAMANVTRETFWQGEWDGNLGGWKLRYDWWRMSDGQNLTYTYYLVYFTSIPNPNKLQFRWFGITRTLSLIGPGKQAQYGAFDISDGFATIRPSVEGTRDTLYTCEDGGTAGRPPIFWFYASTGWTDFINVAEDGPNGDGQYTLHNCVAVPGFYILGW
ncbi:hypothetical protein TWF718_009478 [Orbilia javanica]|uniref:GLEYA adhesin domain-containing protein n=1 Tax=Orbilia javanica TaxID=47235 RepID=A0AAN8RAH8_9PEZI